MRQQLPRDDNRHQQNQNKTGFENTPGKGARIKFSNGAVWKLARRSDIHSMIRVLATTQITAKTRRRSARRAIGRKNFAQNIPGSKDVARNNARPNR